MELIIVTGMSGAGKTQAIACLEDQGYFCIDNMPPSLIKNFIALVTTGGKGIEKAAFVVDIRGEEIFGDLKENLEDLKLNNIPYKILFLEASDAALARRFNETRRVHPMTRRAPTLEDIQRERDALSVIRETADYIVDTSNMKAAKLKEELMDIFSDESKEETFVVNITSFGFKYGLPMASDMVFDLRFIPNPYYVPSLKRATGNSKKVREYVMKYQETMTFIKNTDRLLNNIIPSFMREGKWHLNVAFGCTGGHHRSVVLANEFAQRFERQGKHVTLEHRDVKK